MGIPAQVFESTVDMLEKGTRGAEIMAAANQSAIKFEESNFMKFLFGFALNTRKSMWNVSSM